MKDLLNRVQQHLNENTAVEAEDIQALVDYCGYKERFTENERKNLRKIRNYFLENDITPFEHWAYGWLNRFITNKTLLDDE